MSAATIAGGVLTLQGNADQANAFYVRQATWQRVFGVANGNGEAAPLDGISKIVIDLGSDSNMVSVNGNINVPVEAISPDGSTQWIKAGTTQTITPTNTGSSNTNTSTSTTNNSNNNSAPTTNTTSPVLTTSSAPAPTTTPVVSSTPTVPSTPTAPTTTTSTPAPTTTTSTAPQAVITITDGQTILPGESVHVKALNSTFGTGTVLNDTYQWDFGDPGSQYNDIQGFNAAHAYDTPGNYTVTLTITAPDGQSSVATAQVTVNADTRQTIYVSTDGNDSNSGLSASDPIQSIAQLNKMLTSNTRVLFESGDTFDTASGINVNGYQNVYIGSYGAGAQPVLMYNGGETQADLIAAQAGTEGLVIQGLTFDSIYTDYMTNYVFASAIRLNGSNLTVRDNTFLNVYFDIDMSPCPSNVLIQNNTSPSPTGLRKYFAWVQGNDIAIVGNTVANSTVESVIRVGGANDLLLAENNITNLADAGGNTADISKATLAVQKGTYAYVYDNVLTDGSAGVGPMDNSYPSSVNDQGATFDYSVWNGNLVNNSDLLIQPAAHDILMENNVINTTTGGFVINSTNPLFPTREAENVYIMNNTVINSGTSANFLILNGEAQNVNVDNNLFVAPNFIVGSGGATVYVADNDMTSFTQINDNVWANPQTIPWVNGANFYLNAAVGVQSGYLTPAQWEGTGIPTNDVYQNVVLPAGTYTTSANGFQAGATLPQAD